VATLVAIAVVAGLLVWHFTSGSDGGSGGGASKSAKPAAIPAPLVQGTASAGYDLSTKEVAGVPRGFPQTIDGAVEAATALTPFSRLLGASWTSSERQALLENLGYKNYPDLAQTVAKIQRYYNLNQDGQPASGEAGDRFYNDCLPQYGMYNVQKPRPSASKPTSVWVTVWMPCVEGIGSPSHIDNLHVQWDWYPAEMLWKDGDWQLSMTTSPSSSKPPVPKDKLRPNVSVAERADLVASAPKGFWKLYRGYSEKWPTDLLGTEPKEATK